MVKAIVVGVLAAGVAVGLMACGKSDDDFPVITITMPAAKAEVTVGTDADKSLEVKYTLTYFTVKAIGTCNGAAKCGHVHLNIDGDTCNDPAMTKPYNNASFTMDTAVAKFALCPMGPTPGDHTIKLSLHDDMHADVPGKDGLQVSSTVTIKTK